MADHEEREEGEDELFELFCAPLATLVGLQDAQVDGIERTLEVKHPNQVEPLGQDQFVGQD